MNTPNKIFIAVAAVSTLIFAVLASELLTTNDAGYVQVKQAAGSGDMSVRMEPGLYPRMFADIHTYKISDVYDFNSDAEKINVRFTDASTADISGQIKFRLPTSEKEILQLNQDFRSYEAVHTDLVRQVVASALKQTASLFSSEEVYSTRRSEFVALVNEQIKNGIYATKSTPSGAALKLDEKNEPIISEPSTFKRYGVELVQLVINNIEFDPKTNELIAQRKSADQQKVVAEANAEKAAQDALTAEAQGKARVAEAEADALVKKKTAVIAAEQEKEVAEQQAAQAQQQKLAIVAKGEAEAESAKLKVAAGLTPLDKANIDKETAIGVAHELAAVKFPDMLVIGGGSGGALNPFDAVGLNSFIDISKKLARSAPLPLPKKDE